VPTQKIAQIATVVLRRMEAVTICNAPNVNTIFAGCAFEVFREPEKSHYL
jgi:hypothetical protein